MDYRLIKCVLDKEYPKEILDNIPILPKEYLWHENTQNISFIWQVGLVKVYEVLDYLPIPTDVNKYVFNWKLNNEVFKLVKCSQQTGFGIFCRKATE